MNIGNIDAALTLVTGPVDEVLSLYDAKTHLGLDGDFGDDDDYVTDLTALARQMVESVLKRALLTQTWRLSLRNWPGRGDQNQTLDSYSKTDFIKLPFPPLQSVTGIVYRNSDGQDLQMNPANFSPAVPNSYNVEKDMEPGRIVLPFSGVWPSDILMPGAPIRITYVAGYQDLASLRGFEGYRASARAIKELVGHCYEHRLPDPKEIDETAAVRQVVDRLLMPHRIYD